MQYAVEALQGLECGPQLLNSDVDQTPLCICLLGAQELDKILKYLEEISHACAVGKSNDMADFKAELNRVDNIESVTLSQDCSVLVLDELFLPCMIPRSSCNDVVMDDSCSAASSHIIIDSGTVLDSDAFLSWLFKGPSIREQLGTWTLMKYEKFEKGLKTIMGLQYQFAHLLKLIEKKDEDISYEKELKTIETLYLGRQIKVDDETDVESRSYEYVLGKRREELMEKVNQTGIGLESDAIAKVLKDAESLLDKQRAIDGTYIAANIDDCLHKVDSCIGEAIQRQKEHVSVEMDKADAIIMRMNQEIQLLYVKLKTVSIHDFQSSLVPHMKLFLQVHLENLAEREATEKSDAAKEVILADLSLDSRKGGDGGAHHSKHVNMKTKKKNKIKKNRKNKDMKASKFDKSVRNTLLPVACDEECPAFENSVPSNDHGALKLQENEQKRRTEFEVEERKLDEALENRRQIEFSEEEKHSTEKWTDKKDGGWMTARHPRTGTRNRYIRSEHEDGDASWPKVGKKSPGDDRTLQAPEEPPFLSTSLQPPVMLPGISDSSVSCDGVETNTTKVNSCGTGLKNVFGQYNCFLNVIIQSLWHIQLFRKEFLGRSSEHKHVGDPCLVCALVDIFNSLSITHSDNKREAVDPSSLLDALSKMYPDTSFFKEGQMNDACEVLGLIFDPLHQSFTPATAVTESVDSKCKGHWDCTNNSCISHSKFGMNILEEVKCNYCPIVSRCRIFTSYFHLIVASSLRAKKVEFPEKSFGELLSLLQRGETCDPGEFGCGKLNNINSVLSTAPQVFIAVLSWQNGRESVENIKATLAALSIEIDISALFNGLHPQKRHCLVSVVCFVGLHYKCFAYKRDLEQWVICDDETVKVIGRWSDVLKMCEKEQLQPTTLFFEAVSK